MTIDLNNPAMINKVIDGLAKQREAALNEAVVLNSNLSVVQEENTSLKKQLEDVKTELAIFKPKAPEEAKTDGAEAQG